MSKNVRYAVEYGAIRAFGALLNVLPYRAALFLGWFFAGIAHHVLGVRAAEARRRIRSVFGDQLTERAVRRIAWRSFRNFVFNIIDIARSPGLSRARMDAISAVSFDSAAKSIHENTATGRGSVIACPHMGAWDLAGVAAHLHGLPIFSIAGRQRNPYADAYLNRIRVEAGLPVVMRGSSLIRTVVKELKAGKALAILPDVRMPTEALTLTFLGHTANIGPGMGLFAVMANVPVFPCLVRRIGWSRHHFTVYPPLWPDPEADRHAEARRLTEAVLAIVEAAIRAEPEQWFWYNKRWIFDPIERSPLLPPKSA